MNNRDVAIIALVVAGVLIVLPALGWIGMMGGWGAGHMIGGPWAAGRWGGGTWMPVLGMIFWVLVLVGLGVWITSLARQRPASPRETPLEILKRRLAAGEITREEYEALKKELS